MGRSSEFSLAAIQNLVAAATEQTELGTTGKSVSRDSKKSAVFTSQGNLNHMTPVTTMNFREGSWSFM